tara:strand:+ start:207 stop:704 length:498 start_codon:yes stop_codon:yes gene_type:complete
MKFAEYMLKCRDLSEGGMSRVVRNSKSRSTAVLTASRGDKSNKQNKAANKDLQKKVRSLGYGYRKVEGSYKEKDEKTGESKNVKEKSIVVNAPKKKFRKFKKQMKRLGKAANQDTVITKRAKSSAQLNPTNKRGGKKSIRIGRVKPNTTSPEGQTRVKGKTYTYG